MAKRRKTIDVSEVLARVNALLSADDSRYCNADVRKGAASVLETVLFATGNYAGFNYLGWVDGGCERWIADGKPEDKESYIGDRTRRVYYTSPRLRPRKGDPRDPLLYPEAL
jgi:hypothetical protein